MEGIIWIFLALIVALVALGAVLAGRVRRPPSVEDNPGHCSSCETPMSLRPVPLLKSRALLGEWVCPHCGHRLSKSGRSTGTVA
jgi:DNA-directed RNA polymerase subunit RPC12/RpoP